MTKHPLIHPRPPTRQYNIHLSQPYRRMLNELALWYETSESEAVCQAIAWAYAKMLESKS